ncbi:MAG TPA: EF-hand domain-containing protein [Candidatus Methylomirabilis sp.]|nr:EF-hand domain-containing protein [Candidatus Methylomirabilis sp.]
MRRSMLGALMIAAALLVFAGPTNAQAPARPDWRESFRLHDRNGDGRIDRGEFHDWMVDAFYFRDSNHKGYLVQSDLQGTRLPELFKAMNRKGDGKLTLQELLNALFQDFAAIDVNGTGDITIEEIEAYIRQSGR